MTDTKTCPTCGAVLPSDATGGACPKCLLEAGLATDGGAPPGGGRVPSIEELARKLPGLEILALVGRGGMGVVYRARHRALDREVALKVLPAEVSANPAFADRFQREARALAKLVHPNIVAVHDFGRTDDGFFWLVMEYVDGANIRQAMRAGQIGPKEALTIVPQICDALQYAHERGVVHRDIKPENVLLDRAGRVKVADFGLAKLMDRDAAGASLTGAGQVMGTLHYMAPEQWEHPKDVDHRADIYSLGVVFYEMLTGELPVGRFSAPSRKSDVDARIDEIVMRTLEREREARYQHVADVKTDVDRLSTGGPPKPAAASRDASLELSVGVRPWRADRARAAVVGLWTFAFGAAAWLAWDAEPAMLAIPAAGLLLLGWAGLQRLQTPAPGAAPPAAEPLPAPVLFALAFLFGGIVVWAFTTLRVDLVRGLAGGALLGAAIKLYLLARVRSRATETSPQTADVHVPGWALLALAAVGLAAVVAAASGWNPFRWRTTPNVDGGAAVETPASPRDFEAVNQAGEVASITADDRERIAELWGRLQALPPVPSPDAVTDLYPLTERPFLGDGLDPACITDAPLTHGNSHGSTGAEVARRGREGDLGLPFLARERLPAPLQDFRLVRVEFENWSYEMGMTPMGARAVATNGTYDLWFTFRRDYVSQAQGGAIGPWYFDPGPVIVARRAGADPASRAVAGAVRLLSWVRWMRPTSDLNRYGPLYPADAMRRFWAMPEAERLAEGAAGRLGLPLMYEKARDGDVLRDFRLDGVWPSADGASAKVRLTDVTHGRRMEFRIVRDDGGSWTFTTDPVETL